MENTDQVKAEKNSVADGSPRDSAPEQGVHPTGRPWALNPAYVTLIEGDGVVVASCDTGNLNGDEFDTPIRDRNKANAELIVRAVNAHDALVSTLADMVERFERCAKLVGAGEQYIDYATNNARDVLALARGSAPEREAETQ
jgi:hypothetical protein